MKWRESFGILCGKMPIRLKGGYYKVLVRHRYMNQNVVQ